MKKLLFAALVLISAIYPSFAQISFGDKPASFTTTDNNGLNVQDQLPVIEMPSFDLNRVLLEDEESRRNFKKAVPQRFGYPFDVQLTLKESGSVEMISSNKVVWRLVLRSADAQTINLLFSDFHLDTEAKLFIYNKDHSQILGSFTERNNKRSGDFATGLIKGDEVILEFNGTKDEFTKSRFTLNRLVHGYRSLKLGFGDSGSCNNNVICPEGDPWRNEISGSAMILLGNGTRWCSGSMVNNTREDGTPYFLTANHCLTSSVTSWIIMFNYESADCAGSIDGPLNQTVQGATLVANADSSDFALLRLDDLPPKSYNIYYNGWSALNEKVDSTIGVHHPDGDVKKISFDADSTEHSGYFGSGNTHWEVLDWDDGTTEGGSSGSPLFNKNGQIIGQLHGGNAACGNNQEDYYGKTWFSWDRNIKNDEQLKHWLDACDEGILTLDGRDFNVARDSIDLAMNYVDPGGFFCSPTVDPVIRIRNLGADTITSVTIYYGMEGGPLDSLLWTGSLLCLEEEELTLNTVAIGSGNNVLKIYLSEPNDTVDQFNKNDTIYRSFVGGQQFEMNVAADFFGSQTAVTLADSTGTFLFNQSGFPDLTTTTESFCLADGCYQVIVSDAGNNGMCCDWGQGFFNMFLDGNLVTAASSFVDTVIVNLCITGPTHTAEVIIQGIDELKKQGALQVHPNPSEGILNVEAATMTYGTLIQIYTLEGELVAEQSAGRYRTMLDISNLNNGMYILKAHDKDHWYTEKIVLMK